MIIIWGGLGKIKNLVQVMIALHRSSTNSKNNSKIGIFIQVKITCKNLVMKKLGKIKMFSVPF